jgi:aspartokinase
MEKLKIGGLKQSLELCQFNLRGPDSSEKIASEISKLLASQQINIEFLTYYPHKAAHHRLTICVSQDLYSRVLEILKKSTFLVKEWEVNSRGHVGIVTLFPHHSSLTILGVLLGSWKAQAIPIYGIATSLSAISFVTDYHTIDKATDSLQEFFRLPEGHAPIKPVLRYFQSTVSKKD